IGPRHARPLALPPAASLSASSGATRAPASVLVLSLVAGFPMSSPRSSVNVGARTPGGPNGSTGWQVLDVAFGFFVWAIHFLVLYVATAVVCTLQPGEASAGARTAFLAALALVTLLAAAVVT